MKRILWVVRGISRRSENCVQEHASTAARPGPFVGPRTEGQVDRPGTYLVTHPLLRVRATLLSTFAQSRHFNHQ